MIVVGLAEERTVGRVEEGNFRCLVELHRRFSLRSIETFQRL